jgi:plasmid stability protein
MTTLTVRVSEEAARRLEARAKRLGTTVEDAAARLLEQAPSGSEAADAGAAATRSTEEATEPPREGDTLPGAPHVVFRNGFWVITGELAPGQSWPDPREIREEHLDELMRAALGEDRR